MRTRRQPRYYVEYAAILSLADGVGAGKSERRLYTSDDLKFMLHMASPIEADNWMLALRFLRRRQSTVIQLKYPNYVMGIKVTRC